MDFRWQLAVYDEGNDRAIAVEEYLSLRNQGRVNWEPNLEYCLIFLEVEGKEWLVSNEWWFGRADILISGFEEAHNRLSTGQEAIIRSGDLEDIYPPFLFLEPANDTEVFVSIFFVEDFRLKMEVPFSDELYSYFRSNREKLLQHHYSNNADFKRLACPKSDLLESLQRESRLGRELYELVGMRDGFFWL